MERKRHDIMLYVQCICGCICLYSTSKCYSVVSRHVFETYRVRISTVTRAILIEIFHSISRGIFWNNSSITSRQIPSKTNPFLCFINRPTIWRCVMYSIHILTWQRCEVSSKNIPPLRFYHDRHVVSYRQIKSANIAWDYRPTWRWLLELPTSEMRVYLHSLVDKNLRLEGIAASFFKAEYFIVYHEDIGLTFVSIQWLDFGR